MNIKFYAIVNNGKNKILLASWCISAKTPTRDILLYKEDMAAGVAIKYKHGKIVCEDSEGTVIDSCSF